MSTNWLNKAKKGLTLIELLVSIGLFSTVSILALTVFVNITRIQGRIALENAIYEDARFMMERITRAVRNNAIDYEEYFNKAIPPQDSSKPANQYGDLYGCYAAQFYNPGKGSQGSYSSAGELGALCTLSPAVPTNPILYVGQDNCVVYKPSIDFNTGKFPYSGASSSAPSNAFCPATLISGPTCSINNTETVKELYLIDKDGRTKTIFSKKAIKEFAPNFEYALALLKLNGKDVNNDGITEKWRNCGDPEKDTFCCASGFNCTLTAPLSSLEDTLKYNAGNLYLGFVPISPLRSNVTELRFTISPTEDPRKAFAEESTTITQPKVQIQLTVRPSQDQLNRYGNFAIEDIPSITLQTTISTRVQSEVKSYLGSDTYNIGEGLDPKPNSGYQSNSHYCPLL